MNYINTSKVNYSIVVTGSPIIEFQYNSNGTIENSYRTFEDLVEYEFVCGVPIKYNRSLCDKILKISLSPFVINKNIELVSFFPADNITYFEDTLVIIFGGCRNSLNPKLFQDYHGIKIFLNASNSSSSYAYNEGDYVYKDYLKTDFFELKDIPLPKNIKLANNFGIGTYSDVYHKNIKDLYFWSTNFLDVCNFYHVDPLYMGPSIGVNYLWGLSFDNITKKPLKLKRYFYPSDPLLNNPQLI